MLEIHTLVHAACAMMMYGFWWEKPLDVRDSTKINASAFPDHLALALTRSIGSAFAPLTQFKTSAVFQFLNAINASISMSPLHQWPKLGLQTEASFLLFDRSKLCASLESSDASQVSVMEIAARQGAGDTTFGSEADPPVERAATEHSDTDAENPQRTRSARNPSMDSWFERVNVDHRPPFGLLPTVRLYLPD